MLRCCGGGDEVVLSSICGPMYRGVVLLVRSCSGARVLGGRRGPVCLVVPMLVSAVATLEVEMRL